MKYNQENMAHIISQVTATVMDKMGEQEQGRRVYSAKEVLAREQRMAAILSDPTKLKRFAQKLDSPVRAKKDFVGLTRQLAQVEQVPNGMPLIKDRDYPDIPAIKVGRNGNAIMEEQISERIELEAFEIKSKPKIPYSELYLRLFNTVVRLKDKCAQGMAITEDDYFFALTRAAIALSGQTATLSAALTVKGLAYGFALIEQNRLRVKNVVMSAYGTKDIRALTHEIIGPMLLNKIQNEGYIGSLWGADFFISDRVGNGEVLFYAEPEYVAWVPIRKDVTVIPVDDPDNTQFGLTGYEFISMTIHNTTGVASINFTPGTYE